MVRDVALIVAREDRHELAKRLRSAESAQTRSLIERGSIEAPRVELPIANRLVVAEVDARRVALVETPHEAQRHAEKRSVAHELLTHAEGCDDEESPARVAVRLSRDLQLHEAFSEAERSEDGGAPAETRPLDDVSLEREERRRDVLVAHDEARLWRDDGLVVDERFVGVRVEVRVLHAHITPRRATALQRASFVRRMRG